MTPEEQKLEEPNLDSEEPEPPPPEEPSEPAEEPEAPAAPAPEEVPAEPTPAAEPEPEEEWIEEYEEELEPEKPKKRKKERHLAGPIIVVILIIFLILWTVWSPRIMSTAGDTYVTSPTYANLGNYTVEYRVNVIADLVHASDVVWGVAISGNSTATVGESTEIRVMLTKVSEDPSNFFFRGVAVSLENVSIYQDQTFLANMSGYTKHQFGPVATVPLAFDSEGSYDLSVYLRFTVLAVMRIGFLPSSEVEIYDVHLDVPIVVTVVH